MKMNSQDPQSGCVCFGGRGVPWKSARDAAGWFLDTFRLRPPSIPFLPFLVRLFCCRLWRTFSFLRGRHPHLTVHMVGRQRPWKISLSAPALPFTSSVAPASPFPCARQGPSAGWVWRHVPEPFGDLTRTVCECLTHSSSPD